MRMRPKKNRASRMKAVEDYAAVLTSELSDNKNLSSVNQFIDLEKTFSHLTKTDVKNAPFYLEIGCGKGSFITGLSKKEPQSIIIGMEKVHDVIMLAMEKAKREKCENVRFVLGDAETLTNLIPMHSVDKLFINFCDPWPKKRNTKRRLTYVSFLEKYKIVLKPSGKIYFKTDNRPLFDFSIPEFKKCRFILENVCYDLHASHLERENIHTEYEDNFSAKGFSINYLEAKLLSI